MTDPQAQRAAPAQARRVAMNLHPGALAEIDQRVAQLRMSDRDAYFATLIYQRPDQEMPATTMPRPAYATAEHITAIVPVPLASILGRRARRARVPVPGVLRWLILQDLEAGRSADLAPGTGR